MQVRKRLALFNGNEHGAVAVISALSIFPLLGLTGVALDYSRATDSRSRLNAAADAAALAALKSKPSENPEEMGRKVFHANAETGGVKGLDITYLKVTVDPKRTKSKVTYEAKVKTTIAALIKDHLPIGGTAEATIGEEQDRDVYLVLDTSVSMSFPIDPNQRIPESGGCIFSCHITRAEARAQNATTRLDAGIAAFKALAARWDGNTSETLYSLMSSSRTLRQEINQTSSRTQFDQKADEVAFGSTSHLGEHMTEIAEIVGRASRNRQRTVVLLTDGLEEHRSLDYGPAHPSEKNGHRTWVGAMDGVGRTYAAKNFPNGTPAPQGFIDACTKIKRDGADIAVIYTPNFGIYPGDDPGHQLSEPASRSALERCASPGSLYVVNSQRALDQAVESIAATSSKLRVSK